MHLIEKLAIADMTWRPNERLWVYKSRGGDWLVRPDKPHYHRSSVPFKSHREAILFATERPWIGLKALGYF